MNIEKTVSQTNIHESFEVEVESQSIFGGKPNKLTITVEVRTSEDKIRNTRKVSWIIPFEHGKELFESISKKQRDNINKFFNNLK